MSDYNPNRVNAGKAGAGQFDFKRNTEADLDLAEDTVPAENRVFDNAREALSTEAVPTSLVYVEYGDGLTEEQIDMALKGDWDNLNESVDEAFLDTRHEAATAQAEEEINGLFSQGRFHSEWDDLDDDEKEEAVLAVKERDNSNPTADLLKQTPDQNLRLSVQDIDDVRHSQNPHIQKAISSMDANISDVLGNDPDGIHTQDRIKLVEGILNSKGVETGYESMDTSLRTFVEGSYDNWEGASIDVVWRGSVSEVTPTTDENRADVAGREVSINQPELVMSFNDHEESSGCVIPARLNTSIGSGNHARIDPNPYDYTRNPTTADTTGWRFYNRPPESV